MDFLKSLPHCLSFPLTHHLTSACPFCLASLSSQLSCFLSLRLTLPYIPSLYFPLFSSPSLSLSPSSCILDLPRCSKDCVSRSPSAWPHPHSIQLTPSIRCHYEQLSFFFFFFKWDPPTPIKTQHEHLHPHNTSWSRYMSIKVNNIRFSPTRNLTKSAPNDYYFNSSAWVWNLQRQQVW